MSWSIRLSSAVLLAHSALLAGCGLVYEYPETNTEESAAACSDGVDNDLDGRADCFDSGCAAFCLESDAATCADGKDNDNNGLTDCRDSSCAQFCTETDKQACGDGKDNDVDGLVDCYDPDCQDYCQENSQETCSDGLDNDVDGAKDCRDADCAAFCPESGPAACKDGQDNDHDGKLDCADPDCDGQCPEQSSGDCADGRDNDGDGLTDNADPLCWPFSAPSAVRCASMPATEFFESFDSDILAFSLGPRWFEFGRSDLLDYTNTPQPVMTGYPQFAPGRHDYYAKIIGNTGATGNLDQDLGGMVTAREFSGLWRDVSLSALVYVPSGSELRISLVPAHLAPANHEPLDGAEAAQVGILLDGASASPTMALVIEGQTFATPLPGPHACGLAYCDTGWQELSLTVSGGQLELKLQGAGASGSVKAPLPGHGSFANSRLAVRAGTLDDSVFAGLDDLRLAIGSGSPCNLIEPQVPATACAVAAEHQSFGHSVAVAPSGKGYCALVLAGDALPRAVTSWSTQDGAKFELTDLAPVLPKQASPRSVALAADDDGQLGLALSYTDAGNLRVGLGSAKACSGDVALEDGPPLPSDAEELSYVISKRGHELFYTRPATDQTQRTLWRFQASSQHALGKLDAAELVAELPAGVGHPALAQRIGASDLVLTYPTLPTEGPPSVGVLVAAADAASWQGVEPSPLLAEQGEPGFDQQGVRAVALASSAQGGFLLYGAGEAGVLSTGTAWLDLAGVEPPRLPAPPRCGDGTCDANESCVTCSADCACAGPALLSDAVNPDLGWAFVDPTSSAGDMYFDTKQNTLNFSTVFTDAWLALPLKAPVIGDFELSFDITLSSSGEYSYCDSAYLGLGPPPVVATEPLGVFARVTYEKDCSDAVAFSPLLRTADQVLRSFGSEDIGNCYAPSLQSSLERKTRVLLRRESSTLTVLLADANSCERTTSLSYSGVLPELSTLMFGAAGNCGSDVNGQVSNVELRLLHDPDACPASENVCGSGKSRSCVDLKTDAQHCGTCTQACGADRVCVAGKCACDATSLTCNGTCVDPQTDAKNCGACGKTCKGYCFLGKCDAAGTCAAPIALPSGSSSTRFDIAELSADLLTLCSKTSYANAAFKWTAKTTGIATAEVQGADGKLALLFGVGTDATCETFTTCDRYGYGQRIEFFAQAGQDYYLVAGLADAAPTVGAIVDLRIEAP